jgi:hypothetical protein
MRVDVMGKRRKGEQPVPKRVVGWSDDHQVARCLRGGDRWFFAWAMQMCTPFPTLARRTGIAFARLQEMERATTITRAELEALAKAWWITPEGLEASMPADMVVT